MSSVPRAILFGQDLSHWSSGALFTLCASGIFVCYGVFAVLQESIFRIPNFDYGLYLTFCSFGIYSVISYFVPDPQEQAPAKPVTPSLAESTSEIRMEVLNGTDAAARTDKSVTSPTVSTTRNLTHYAVVAFCSVSTQGLSNVSCQYLNYPTQVIFKCCKLLPVMLVGACYLKKSYSLIEYSAMTLLTAGLIVFSAGNVLEEAQFDPIGVMFICGALMADAVIGNVQEYVLKTFRTTTAELMFYTKFYGLLMLFVALVITGQLLPSIAFSMEQPGLYWRILGFSVSGCIGEFFVITLIQRFGALVAVITTSLRKMASIVLSFVIFPKVFSMAYVLGTFMVFSGLSLEVYVKNSTAIHRYWETYLNRRTTLSADDRAVV